MLMFYVHVSYVPSYEFQMIFLFEQHMTNEQLARVYIVHNTSMRFTVRTWCLGSGKIFVMLQGVLFVTLMFCFCNKRPSVSVIP